LEFVDGTYKLAPAGAARALALFVDRVEEHVSYSLRDGGSYLSHTFEARWARVFEGSVCTDRQHRGRDTFARAGVTQGRCDQGAVQSWAKAGDRLCRSDLRSDRIGAVRMQ